MAMTKRETAEMAELREQLAQARALHWPGYGAPAPMHVGSIAYDEVVVGWYAHTWDTDYRVSQGCTNGIDHSDRDTTRTTTQGPGRFYATRLDALRQARLELTERCAKALAAIDAEIAEAEQAGLDLSFH